MQAKTQSRAVGWVRCRFLDRPWILAAWLVVVIGLAGAIGFGLYQGQRDSELVIERGDTAPDVSIDAEPDRESKSSVLVVDVSGSVVSPGVYELDGGARIEDAIEAAGGLAEDADVLNVNRASLVVDGQKVLIPSVSDRTAASMDAGSPGDSSPTAASGGVPSLVSINSATEEELDALSGVGPATARAIVEDRNSNGPFSSLEDLMRVSGIGEKKFEKLKGQICL